jgi:MFS family permease
VRGRPLLRLAVVGLGTLVVPLDSMVNVAFPAITARFAIPIAGIQWVVICYVLAQSSLMLVFGRIGDMLGYRRIFLLGSAWSVGAFLACTLAPSFFWLLVARALQGVGAGLLLSCGPALATQLFPEAMRARVLGLYTMMFALGGALGPAAAGLLVAHWGWAAVYAVRVPMSLLAFACAWALPVFAPHARRERFDSLGAVLLSAGIAALLLALAQLRGPAAVPVLLAGCGLACLALYAGRRTAAAPIIDPGLFRLPGFAFVTLASVGLNLAGFAVLLLVPFYLARFASLSTPVAGLLLALSPLGTVLAAPLAGRLAGHVPARALMLAGMAASSLGLALLVTAGAAPPIALLAGAMLVQGLGMGAFQVAYFDVVTATLPLAARGVAGSLGMLTRTVGLVAGASVLILVFQTLREAAERHGMPASDAFLSGFHGAVLLAAVVPVALAFGLRRLPP